MPSNNHTENLNSTVNQSEHVPSIHTDLLVVGAGLAGLTVALKVAEKRKVIVLAKRDLTEAATAWAQGGIVGVLDEKDSFESHVGDTLEAGAGIVSEATARYITENSQQAIQWLVDQEVAFTQDPEGPLGLHLTREGGHTHRRIAHAADATGKAIHIALLEKAKAHPNIQLLENWVAIDLITTRNLKEKPNKDYKKSVMKDRCFGVYALDIGRNEVVAVTGNDVVVATGGVGKVYKYTSNPDTSTGDGIAMAYRAGCRVGNMEFIQFHPTCLYHPQERSFLITEALRGEGAYLKLPNGYRFMADHDERLELAPRDIVARAIDFEIKKHGIDYVLLDGTHLGAEFLKEHFPTIYARCLAVGIDITKQGIPVVPAAHYTCGGVVTDLHGQTDLPHLYSAGEATYTGLHGANRLASNSLLECVVIGKATADKILEQDILTMPEVRPWDDSQVEDADEQVVIAHNWDELRSLMWNYVGIVRTTKRLERALHRIELLKQEVQDYYSNFHVNRDLIELRNLIVCAELIVLSALERKESRGLHYSRDYPQTFAMSYPTIITPKR
ncbi:L-aspartate oxidase [Polynucleobacter sp. SHI8]|uniref:L-aspartate oxidase n=1 Tax=unclassified Polynucleobacter TaxID=2640945 RepID=UPI00249054DB|nr:MULTISPECIES: L-aspartate oxidase [unclassified Polynucleobacter]BDW11637.1 L-aspartate oxidase [Polynucleobacter sp. SHI2]BDW14084.1 L-aspartate oxidase [Polynucleobacter sp. SHI8]